MQNVISFTARESDKIRAHRREVGEIDGEGLPAESMRVGVGQEVRAIDQHVGGDRQLHSRRRREQRAIVARPEHRLRRRPCEVTRDQIEFGGH